jgi:hypothetical protein
MGIKKTTEAPEKKKRCEEALIETEPEATSIGCRCVI